ncbi:hypothetical protein [Falsiroseomonas tokyonensis]|uniref:DUF2892 domain-containing protein n=1 Tax=Falsiroseomonas tokyonensis TaxID=430521 RepID=A0ABV7C5J9_9PROT|nr:hypothetical protein [Falsiroseomonas tokyonensis]MBU8541918.1 hypothetical protein [Falsiroseomonas tokyonensis]
MNALTLPTSPGETPPDRWRLADRLPSWLRGRRAVMLGVVTLVIAGLAFGWPWLVAFGLAPLVLSLLPCAAMCALGLCMMGGKDGKSCHSQANAPGPEARASRQNA